MIEESYSDFIESSRFSNHACIDLLESCIDLLESCIDLLESCIDLYESCIEVNFQKAKLLVYALSKCSKLITEIVFIIDGRHIR